jgi:hypothetical protein
MGAMDQQALIIYLDKIGERADEMGLDALDALLALQEELAQAIEPGGFGEVDGNEIAMDDSEGSLYAYGPDAKALLMAALPPLAASPLSRGGHVELHYGPAASGKERVESFLLADLCARRNG